MKTSITITSIALATLTSVLAFAAEQPGDAQKIRTPKEPLVPAAVISKFDRDGDGQLDLKEWSAFSGLKKSHRERTSDGEKESDGETKEPRDEEKAERNEITDFQKFDTDEDNFVSLAELAARAGGPAKEGENK